MPAGALLAVGVSNWSTCGGAGVVVSVGGGATVGAGDEDAGAADCLDAVVPDPHAATSTTATSNTFRHDTARSLAHGQASWVGSSEPAAPVTFDAHVRG